MINKDIVHPKMKRLASIDSSPTTLLEKYYCNGNVFLLRRIERPRIMLLDCSLEYKKGESQTNIEITQESDFTCVLNLNDNYTQLYDVTKTCVHNINCGYCCFRCRRILQMEEEYVQQICEDIIRLKPDLVITEKGVSDLAQHFLVKAGISVLRRVRKTDNNRIARACGATIANRTDEVKEEDIGTGAGLFEVKKFGDECVMIFHQTRTYNRPKNNVT